MRSADHLSNEKEEKGFDAWHKIILGGFDLLLDTLPSVILGIITISSIHTFLIGGHYYQYPYTNVIHTTYGITDT